MSVKPFPFFSGALYQRKLCNVYLPPSYDSSVDRRYPVIYLLHGLYGDESSWILKGTAEQTLDDMIAAGELRECIVVMPSDGGYGQGTFYINWYDGSGRFEDYFLYDLIPAIDRELRTIADRSQRAIGGLSMGGFGAFALALRHPDMFGAAASISGALTSTSLITEELLRTEISRMIGPVQGPYAREHDLHMLAARLVREENRPMLHFNCGTSDYLYALNTAYKELLDQLGYPHEYFEFEGEHNWDYFRVHVKESLQFIEKFFALT